MLDSGAGLAPEVMERLYEAFFSTKVEGMGIGLNLCRTIVESHQGRMQAENIYNGAEVAGCRFSFWIPVSAPALPIRIASKDAGVTDMSLIPKKGTVYVVDDDEAVRDSLQWLLEGKDYRVRCFDSAESFLSRYDPREVACLIVDIRMGGMTGLELQDRLLERKSPLPVVFITGHGDVPMAVNTMKKGAMDFIQKPFKEDELVSLVERMLEHARGAFAEYQSAASRDALLSKLTSREAQVLERIVAGRLNKQIADDLGISIKTVEAHRANIMEKLNANTVADLLKIALGQKRQSLTHAHRKAAPSGLCAFSETRHDRTTDRRQRACQADPRRSRRAHRGPRRPRGVAARRSPSSWWAKIRPARSTRSTRSTTARDRPARHAGALSRRH